MNCTVLLGILAREGFALDGAAIFVNLVVPIDRETEAPLEGLLFAVDVPLAPVAE